MSSANFPYAHAYKSNVIMSQQMATAFKDWLTDTLEEREWTQADLARQAKVSPTAISDILSGRRNVGKNTAKAIATALKIPPEQVFRVAGILPPAVNINEEIETIIQEVEKLSEQDQAEVLAFIRMKQNMRKNK